MHRRLGFAATLCVAASVMPFGVAPADATSSNASFAMFVEDNSARASSGDVVEVALEGTFDAASKRASGEGTFEHRTAGGELVGEGTVEIERLVSFQFYGCGVLFGDPIPADFCGGRALLAAHLVGQPASDPSATIELDALLEINCQIGDPPAGTGEGIKLNVKDLINFTKHVAGENLFVVQ